jgi:hypothetical protein
MQSRADRRGQTDSVGEDYGGGCATGKGMERAAETKQRSVGCTDAVNPILSIAAIVASNSGDLVRGAFGVQAPARPAFLLRAPLANQTYTRSGSRMRVTASGMGLSSGKWRQTGCSF